MASDSRSDIIVLSSGEWSIAISSFDDTLVFPCSSFHNSHLMQRRVVLSVEDFTFIKSKRKQFFMTENLWCVVVCKLVIYFICLDFDIVHHL
jgi:hypothetical protein